MMTRKWLLFRNFTFVLGFGFLVIMGLSTAASFYVYKSFRQVLPDVTVLREKYPVPLKKTDNRIVYTFKAKRPANWVSVRQLSRKTIHAILTAEDAGFFSHGGFDPKAMREAWEHNKKPGVKTLRGGSTITQQVVKNIFLSRDKTITRKVRELMLAVELEEEFTKNKILELYLNVVEWGPGVYGIEQASRYHFNKSSVDLTVREAAILAFMLPNPIKYKNSYRNGELSWFGKMRVEDILNRMRAIGYISDDEYVSNTAAATEASSLNPI